MSCIGAITQVRGLGLFIGVELVTDRSTLDPAASLASEIANTLATRHVLISTDGPYHNVLKLKPPMCFSMEDGMFVIALALLRTVHTHTHTHELVLCGLMSCVWLELCLAICHRVCYSVMCAS